jgi:hypothetical protein
MRNANTCTTSGVLQLQLTCKRSGDSMTGSLTARSSLAGSEKDLYNSSDLFETDTVHRLVQTCVLEWDQTSKSYYCSKIRRCYTEVLGTIYSYELLVHLNFEYI